MALRSSAPSNPPKHDSSRRPNRRPRRSKGSYERHDKKPKPTATNPPQSDLPPLNK